MDIATALAKAAADLAAVKIAEPRKEAASLLAFSLDQSSVFLYAHPEYVLTRDEAAKFAGYVSRRANREPFQYITGKQEFFGLEFAVRPGILIPRPETEILVETAIHFLKPLALPRFCELGVGSGCISISILNAVKDAAALGVDISPAALVLTEENAAAHGAASSLQLVECDLFEKVTGRFDMIVSNPPYISEADRKDLQPEVKDFEPPGALFAGGDGLDIIRRIIADSPPFLLPNSYLLIEIGFGQAADVKDLFGDSVWQSVALLPDLQGIPRIVVAQLSR
ncbi:MAG: peptide chain release factor N(5)-glutamine methyltransferase [Pyrinomonadaceae bacterium]